MIVHLVLFRPKQNLPDSERRAFVGAIARAHREVASIRRFTIGERILCDAAYAQLMPEYPYAAVVEFEDERGLQEYLAHPAHRELGRLFWETSDSPLAYDYRLVEPAEAMTLLGKKNSSIS